MAKSPASDTRTRLDVTDELIDRQVRALLQHQRVMHEAAEVARIARQARNRAAANPVFARPTYPESARSRVSWNHAG